MRTLIELETGQCRYPVSDEIPSQVALCKDMPFAQHLFCGDATAAPDDPQCVYCAKHHQLAFGGYGKDWRGLEAMMKGIEKTVTYRSPDGNNHKASDVPDTTPELPEILSTKRKVNVA